MVYGDHNEEEVLRIVGGQLERIKELLDEVTGGGSPARLTPNLLLLEDSADEEQIWDPFSELVTFIEECLDCVVRLEGEETPLKVLDQFWRETPPRLPGKYDAVIDAQELADHALVLIPKFLSLMDDRLSRNHLWKRGSDEVKGALKHRVLEKLAEHRRTHAKENRENE